MLGLLSRRPAAALASALARRCFTVAIDGPAASGKSSTARAVARELGFGYIDSGSIYRCATLLALRKRLDGPIASHSQELVNLISHAMIEISIQASSQRSVQSVTGAGRLVVPDLQIMLDGEDVSREIRTPDVNRLVAKVASDSGVRTAVLAIQRSLAAIAESQPAITENEGKQVSIPGGVVMDGRDIGTTVFPNAELKIYLDASAMARAIRRWDELSSQFKEAEASRKKGEAGGKDGAEPAEEPAGYPSVEDIARELEQRDYADINREHSPLRIAPSAVVIDNTNMTFEQQVYTITDLARERMGLPRKYDDL
ncbi:hypothetical protein GGF46_003697 [Coemansia sp. RSA 552]|nr:hypothetical protein GGF46_003697 [Coemansia sp. RSA 552]